MKPSLKRLALFLVVAGATILLAIYLQTRLYRVMDSNDRRFVTLMGILNDKKHDNVLLFGDSRGVLGVDTKVVKARAGFDVPMYNLANFSQSLYQSSYFYGMIEKNTKMVVQCTSPEFFATDEPHRMPEVKAIPMYLSGYRANEQTKKLIPDYNRFFDKPAIDGYFECREYFRNYITTAIRPFFDNERYNQSLMMDKYFPHIYIDQKSPNYPVQQTGCAKYQLSKYPKTQIAFLKKTKAYFDSKGIEYVIILMPINPDDCNDHALASAKTKEMLERETGIRVVDLTSLLPVNDFYDAVHANHHGAAVLSNTLGDSLQKRRSVKM
ncbi:hypothetical protein HYN48_09505 [Flavobacterium magnum]|uniref:SGNH/GDSL hydrolase family protein n=1 Tax=Flavobacterium magnum TaxID=2162713 RepID=A0A2S0RGR9_9FLAO|nr:hypothetical protein [Flavobacterium magnum]AWA30301.1 hypothetical protein HYN48_09505 [Flavobacterium magnum]